MGFDLRQPPARVTLRLEPGWAGRDVDLYTRFAWVTGLFADAGLAVRIGLGPACPPEAGPQLAVVDAAAVPDRWQVMTAVQQHTSIGLVGFADTGLSGPADLPGRVVGLPSGSVARLLWPEYAARTAGLDPTTVTTVTTVDPVAELAAGRLDAAGRSVTVLPYARALPKRCGSVLIAPRWLVRDRTGLADRFTAALLTAARFAMDDPDDVARVLHRAYLVDDRELVAAELLTMRPYAGRS